MAITQDWQLEYNGLLLGAGTNYRISSYEGLASIPDIRASDRTRLRRHGMLPGSDFLGGRSIVLNFIVLADTESEFSAAMQAFKLALMPCTDEMPLSFQIPAAVGAGGVKVANVRARRIAAPINRRWAVLAPEVAVEFFATDPRIYADTQQYLAASLPIAGGGATFNATFNWVFGTVTGAGSIQANNSGTFPTPVELVIAGPVTNPRIENLTQDKTLAFTLTLATGESLTVNTDTRTVMLNGTASRYSSLDSGSEWFDLQPGINEIRFAASTNTAATMTAYWRSAWV